ncbi:hypothetical protein GIB67_025357 [Kingdonia uniflora]|uniref:ENT domain-containing protein n=1 Tax=Kingdonia uniflora TaxID=39325 RepID=A0A7J7NBA6_9MAGN|nr:hypothetical protein GIB67_025357 [Kingdonia uniflora]
MRIKKGSEVEVFSDTEVPSGSWRRAQIISGNGHNYDVGYVSYVDATGVAVMDRVSRKVIRPCPPFIEGANNWVSGDIVEVFDNMSWKIATVSKVVSGKYFLVRLLGSSQEFEAHICDLRVRLTWEDGKWVIVRKGSGICEDRESNIQSTSRCYIRSSYQVTETDEKINLFVGDNFSHVQNDMDLQESSMLSSKTLKRGSPYDSSDVEGCAEAGKKRRAIEKGGCQQITPCGPSPLSEKVDAVAPTFCDGLRFSERAKTNYDVGFSTLRGLESSEADRCSSSVGSCSSTSDIPHRLSRSLTSSYQDTESHSSDAESFCGRDYVNEDPLSPEEDFGAELHRIELHAYRRTMEALYISGPLSWERETLVTNLRLTLHISNDEHLTEVRNLVSSKTNIALS